MRESSCFPRKTIYVTAQFSRSSHNNNQNVSLVLLHPLARTMSGRDFLGNDNAKGSKRWRRLGTISSQFYVFDERSLKNCKLPTTSCPKNSMTFFSIHITARIFQLCHSRFTNERFRRVVLGAKATYMGELDRSLYKRSELLTYWLTRQGNDQTWVWLSRCLI